MGTAEFWSLKPVLLPGDAGAVRVRRKLKALIEAEGSTIKIDPAEA
jgi:vanillate O-demethylase monooxygenase subunit